MEIKKIKFFIVLLDARFSQIKRLRTNSSIGTKLQFDYRSSRPMTTVHPRRRRASESFFFALA